MKKIFCFLTALVAATILTPTQTQAQEGFYGGGFAGANFISTGKVHDVRQNYKTGYAVAGFFGYRWTEGLRVEGELSYRRNKLESIKFDCYESLTGYYIHKKPHLNQFAIMANVLFDIDVEYWNGCYWPIMPYVGAGLGYSHQNLHFKKFEESGYEGFDYFRFSRKGSGFAWQVIFGLMYQINPCTDISVEYRMLRGDLTKLYNHGVGITAKYHFR